MSFIRTAAETLMKELYEKDRVDELLFKNRPLLESLKKSADTDFDGRYFYIAAMYSNANGASFTATVAESNENASNQVAFQVRPSTLYQYPKIAGSVVRAAKRGSGKGQLMNLLESQIDGAMRTMGNKMSKSAYGNAGGSLGKVQSVTTTVLTLTDVNDTWYWEQGMKVCAAAVDGTGAGSLVAAGIAITISSVDRTAGTLTTLGDWTTLSGISNGYFLFEQGDFKLAPSGLLGWAPNTAPGIADSFNGVNRFADPTRLGGLRYDGRTESFEEVFHNAMAQATREGLEWKELFIHPITAAKLKITKEGTRVVTKSEQYDWDVAGFEYGGAIFKLDAACPAFNAFCIGDGAYDMKSIGDVPSIGDDDGNRIRLQSGDTYQVQLVADYAFTSAAPGHIQNVLLPLNG